MSESNEYNSLVLYQVLTMIILTLFQKLQTLFHVPESVEGGISSSEVVYLPGCQRGTGGVPEGPREWWGAEEDPEWTNCLYSFSK